MGFHKTGTTSIQKWLNNNGPLLGQHNLRFYKGVFNPSNHIEFGLSVLRDHLDAPIKSRISYNRDALHEQTGRLVSEFVGKDDFVAGIISNETMSFMREDFESERLLRLFPHGTQIVPVVFLRDKKAWLNSYRAQIGKMGMTESADPASCSYFKSDSWLLQHEKLVELLERNFGNVQIVQYTGNSVNDFLRVIGVPLTVSEPRENVTPPDKPDRLA